MMIGLSVKQIVSGSQLKIASAHESICGQGQDPGSVIAEQSTLQVRCSGRNLLRIGESLGDEYARCV